MDWPLTPSKIRVGTSARRNPTRYQPPSEACLTSLRQLLARVGQQQLLPRQLDLLRSPGAGEEKDVNIYYAGNLSLLDTPTVAVVGTREVSDLGRARTRRVTRELVEAGITVMSGLARGVDAEAHRSAISVGGKTVAVIGTPLSKAYPAENAGLQEEIYREHLLMSPFAEQEKVLKGNFPKRNRIMAALSAATVIVEASDTSGTLHQAAECQRLGRWLFIAKAVVEDPSLTWPSKFLGKPRTGVLVETSDILRAVKPGA
jgi:DNA processing protein